MWAAQSNMPVGAILPVQTVWVFATLWYSDRLDATFRGRSVASAQAIFQQLGLTGPFWRPTAP